MHNLNIWEGFGKLIEVQFSGQFCVVKQLHLYLLQFVEKYSKVQLIGGVTHVHTIVCSTVHLGIVQYRGDVMLVHITVFSTVHWIFIVLQNTVS